MKKLLFVSVLIIVSYASQSQSWQWAKSIGGVSYAIAYSSCTDNSGNFYITGQFRNSITFGSTTLTGDANGNADIFVAKINSAGQWQWAKKAGGNDHDAAYAICCDVSGNLYITGWFSQSADFGSTHLTDNERTTYVAKLNSSGQWQWAVKVATSTFQATSEGKDIAVDNSGNIYIVGRYSGTVTFGTITLNNADPYEIYVAKLTSLGVWQWAVKTNGNCYKEGNGITLDNIGNCYISGCVGSGVTAFGTDSIKAISSSGIVAKLNSSGQWQWAKIMGTTYITYQCWGGDIIADDFCNIYLVGEFRGKAYFGADTLSGHPSNQHGFFAKIDSSGQWQWAKNPGLYLGSDLINGITKDNSGNILLTGHFKDSLKFGNIKLYNPQSNNAVMAVAVNSSGQGVWGIISGSCQSTCYVDSYTISENTFGNVIIAGGVEGTVQFGNYTVNASTSFFEILIAKFNAVSGINKNLINTYDFNVYPNPASNIITVDRHSLKSNSETISIYDIKGQLLLQQAIYQEKTEIDISILKKGVYIISLSSIDKIGIAKFVKE